MENLHTSMYPPFVFTQGRQSLLLRRDFNNGSPGSLSWMFGSLN